jgi:FdrA protein
MTSKPNPPELLTSPVRAVNVGLEVFHQSLRAQGVEAVHVDWQPPAGGDQRLASILDKLSGRKKE